MCVCTYLPLPFNLPLTAPLPAQTRLKQKQPKCGFTASFHLRHHFRTLLEPRRRRRRVGAQNNTNTKNDARNARSLQTLGGGVTVEAIVMASYSTCSPTAKVLQKVLSLYFFFFCYFVFGRDLTLCNSSPRGRKLCEKPYVEAWTQPVPNQVRVVVVTAACVPLKPLKNCSAQ